MQLTLDQQRRYARQIMLADVGEAGQQKLLDARVLVIGAGGIGSALISYLAAAGVGTIGIIDPDRVERSNLARQIIHETGDIGRLKVESASDRIAELNPEVNSITHPFALIAENATALFSNYNIIADGCDNFATRFVVNATCIGLGKPLISAAIAGWQGNVLSVIPQLAPTAGCYQCFVNPEATEAHTCRESGIMGPLAGIIGAMQALEVIHTILGHPALAHHIAFYDAHSMSGRKTARMRDANCPICSA